MNQGYNKYKNVTIETADQGKLILIAYDVAIKHAKLALENFGDYQTIEARTKHLFKVQDAITELMSALDLSVGDVAVNLYRLYDYMIRGLVDANMKGNQEKVVEVLSFLESLRSAWSEAILKVKSESAQSMQTAGLAISG